MFDMFARSTIFNVTRDNVTRDNLHFWSINGPQGRAINWFESYAKCDQLFGADNPLFHTIENLVAFMDEIEAEWKVLEQERGTGLGANLVLSCLRFQLGISPALDSGASRLFEREDSELVGFELDGSDEETSLNMSDDRLESR